MSSVIFVNKENSYLRDTDVTDVVAKQGWSLKKPLVVKMTKSVGKNLPEPVMMYNHLGKDGDIDQNKSSIALNPNADPSRYGDLIEGFTIKERKKEKNCHGGKEEGLYQVCCFEPAVNGWSGRYHSEGCKDEGGKGRVRKVGVS